MIRPTGALLALGLAAALAPSARAATGTVFADQNGDGRRQAGGAGLADVEVSNGVDVVRTDARGRYDLPDRPGGRIFVVKPRGWQSPMGSAERPHFYGSGGTGAVDFPLTQVEEPDDLRALILTDPQPSTPAEVGYLAKGLVERAGPQPGITFGVTLGDVVYDRPDLFEPVAAAVAAFGLPWYYLPGNHDLSLATPDEAAAVAPFETVFGPSTYAFHAGPALFVALDDVRPQGGPRYVGGLTGDQFTFLGNLLKETPPSEWVVLMFHIPLFSPDPAGTVGFRTADRLRLFQLLAGRSRLLVLSGHTHYLRHVTYGPDDGWKGPAPLCEYNVAAACGGFWSGPKDPEGIPAATMWDGTPPGYGILHINGDHAAVDYLPSRFPADHQLSIHVPAAVAPRQGYVSFYANVFNGGDDWQVEARVDDQAWVPLRRILGWDPTYADAFLLQDRAAQPIAGPRLPDPVVSFHLWRGYLPANLSVGGHALHVRAADAAGRVFTAEQTFRTAAPP